MAVFLFPDSYRIDVSALDKNIGSYEECSTQISVQERIGVDLIGILPQSKLDCALQFHTIENAVLVTGLLDAFIEGECARCLDGIVSPIRVQFTELFHYEKGAKNNPRKSIGSLGKKSSPVEEMESDEETLFIHNGVIDIEQTIINAVADELPLIPLCRVDCAGLCAQCGENLNFLSDPDGHSHGIIDARFAKLTDFFPQASPESISEHSDGN